MDHVLSQAGLRLTYLSDPYAIRDLDQTQILDQLAEEDPTSEAVGWGLHHRLTDYDHVVLAADRWSGRCLALLVARDEATTNEAFLLIEHAFVARSARGRNLTRRMIALAILRMAGMSTAPTIVAARAASPVTYHILRGLADRFIGARFFPEPDKSTINLQTASLARRIARTIYPSLRFEAAFGTIRGASGMLCWRAGQGFDDDPRISALFDGHVGAADQILAVLDLRGRDDACITNDALRLYRGGKAAIT